MHGGTIYQHIHVHCIYMYVTMTTVTVYIHVRVPWRLNGGSILCDESADSAL